MRHCFRRYGFYREASMPRSGDDCDMMDIKLIRENPGSVIENLERRGAKAKVPLVDEAVRADSDWRKLKTEVDALRHRQNRLTADVAAKKKKGEPIEDLLK